MKHLLICSLLAGLTACGPSATPPVKAPEASPEAGSETETTESKAAPAPEPYKPPAFPSGWVGRWHGNILAKSARGSREFGMILDIEPTDNQGRFRWKITYAIDGNENVRDYELVTVDAEKGSFQIDEKNSIVIDALFAHQTLFTLFDVGGMVIDFRYTMTPEGIRVDVASSKPGKATETGGEGKIPVVKNLPLEGTQRGLLVRMPAGKS